MSREQILQDAIRSSWQFASGPGVSDSLVPFLDGSWLDPLFYWSLYHCQRNPRTMMVLHNWGDQKSNDKVINGWRYTNNCFYLRPCDYNASFFNLLRQPWSRELIASRDCLVLNAAWGIKCGGAEGKLKSPDAYFAAAEYLWLRLAKDYYQPKRLILCGRTWMTVRFATAPDHLTNSLTLARDSLSNTEVIPHYHPSRISQWNQPLGSLRI
jgi:hypothetical protein